MTKKRRILLALKSIFACLFLVFATYGVMGLLFYFGSPVHSRPDAGSVSFDISPAGDQIVFTGLDKGRGDIFLFDMKTSHVTQVTKTPDYESDPTFSPDGTSIAYAAGVRGDRADHVYIRTLDGKMVKQITTDDFNDKSPAFSPDGTWITFTRNIEYRRGGLAPNWGADSYVYVVRSDGAAMKRLTDRTLRSESPCFSQDGKSVYFTADGIFIVPADGARPPRKISTVLTVHHIARAPNGKWLAYAGTPDNQSTITVGHLCAINVDGSGNREIEPRGSTSQMRVAPNGKTIYFLDDAYSRETALWHIGKDGNGLRRVVDGRLFQDPLHWKP